MGIPSVHKRRPHHGALPVRLRVALGVALAATACTTADPVYIASVPPSINTGELAEGEVGALVMTVPVRLETAEEAAEREEIAAELGLTAADIPSVRRDDLEIEIEWAITNPGGEEVEATLGVVGANELFRYDPAAFVDPEDDDAEPPPALMGGEPIIVPAGATVSGVFTENDFSEAAQDLDAFTRAGVNAFNALLTKWRSKDVTGGEGGALAMIPSKAIAQLLEVQLTVSADDPVIISAQLRVRDRTGRLDATATDVATLVPPSMTVFMPVFETEP
jgi:hypothetical protein